MDLYRVTKLPLYLLFTVHHYSVITTQKPLVSCSFYPFELFMNGFYQLSLIGEFLNLNLPSGENMTLNVSIKSVGGIACTKV